MKYTLQVTLTIFVGVLFFGLNGFAQKSSDIKYYPSSNFTMVGKIMDTDKPFHRIDTAKYSNIPEHIKTRLTRSAGLAISFKTNSKSIHAKWCTTSKYPSSGMTPIAFRGLDLYTKINGKWQFAGVGRPKSGENSSEGKLVANLNGEQREYLLYLPVYSETTSLEIGVENTAKITAGDQPFNKRILVYGSSIVQGAGASRPGMAYTSRMSRNTGFNFLNLGMSGVARMEKEVANMVADIEADVYLLDCIPNSSPKEITQRTGNLIKTIRSKNPNAPIILMQSVVREIGFVDEKTGEKVKMQNKNAYDEFMKLHQSGMKNIYFIFGNDFLGDDHEGTVDGTHPNDLGFDRMIKAITPQILPIINQ
ncbi:SGNH/GDSL hydrolase family protein [Aestuariibaculum sediminum]|uniref:SGNH/GDSL hydrolase family protein n=1 Tax=Aestuariibaculum sediminum TaxID=2770637 RepID=A0A8J6Q4H7_9FLAO|nr:SGNH/GDSL hydrolase family protein [Aestuariibaculum sediminum]MBD0833665.1 SGNH/GDSL hydrolase family protein [Aestuariibaculum sediminum]